MKLNWRTSFFAAFAVVGGLIVLLGYFLPALAGWRDEILRWAVILAAVLLLVGVINLARVHWRKFARQQSGGWYSLILLISLGLTLVVAVAGYISGDARILTWLFNYVQVPIESSLMAILAIVLAYAAARMLNRSIDLFSILFIGVVVIVLLGTITLPMVEIGLLRDFRNWIVQVVAMAGARGILLGVALGTIATGLRVIFGADRPYGG